jgi:predicted  nucleic acid-binding Zn-ribbon protein
MHTNRIQEVQTAEDKLRALYRLQKNDSKIDEIRTLRGELPIEVQDLEDELEGLNTRIKNSENEIADLQTIVSNHQNNIVTAEAHIVKYTKQQDNVKNNREFEALNKEIEMQKLEIELSRKRIKDTLRDIETKSYQLQQTQNRHAAKMRDLEVKKKELEQIIEETGKEEVELIKQSNMAKLGIEERLISAYNRIRSSYRNGLAVVAVERDSCGGCFGKIPPQRQVEIRQHKKIILCEHCGRILVDEVIENEEGPI